MNGEETTEILDWTEKYVQCFKLLLQIDMSSVTLVVNDHWDNYQKELHLFIEVALQSFCEQNVRERLRE